MSADAKLAEIAALLGDPARANILMALMDGRAHTAKELAYRAHVAAPTASAHLTKLHDAKLVAVAPSGRHRYYRLASADVARIVEGVGVLAAAVAPGSRRRSAVDRPLLFARTCYDHIAGTLGVALADRLQADGRVVLTEEGGAATPDGLAWLVAIGLDLPAERASGRVFCRSCMDWTERRFHLAGALGAGLLGLALSRGWVERSRDSRALAVTAAGACGFQETFGIDLAALGRDVDQRDLHARAG